MAGVALAQSVTTVYTTDLNGHRVTDVTRQSADSTKTEKNASINGRQVPLERTEQRVVRDDASGKTTETIVRKYDPNGQLMSTQRTVTEEQKLGAGSSNVRSTTYVTDINGREQLTERKNVENRGTTAQTAVERPTLNGSLETVEKTRAVTQGTDAKKTTTENVYRRGQNGQFYEAARRVETDVKAGTMSTSDKAEYELDTTGAMRLKSQSVAVTSEPAPGQQTTNVDLYAASADGRVQEPGARPQIKEHQVITRSKGKDGSVVETLSVRRPTIADPNKLGDLQKISESVCTGKCAN